ncbi:hypothetical protein [Promineifilum sp.]|uniref:hypothetical protein n=1 Tax=Promineifilum sp. TaxID=2664178 RepID=UPI0035B2218C
MRRLKYLLFGLLLLAACAPPANTAAPPTAAPATPTHPAALTTPQSNFFYGLPSFRAGETAEYEGYQITLTDVVLDGGELSLTLDLRNETDRAVDLGWAVQLHHRQSGYVSPVEQPAGAPPSLGPAGATSGVWRYDLGETAASDAPMALEGYLLLYAPRGWSGPVVVYRLDD